MTDAEELIAAYDLAREQLARREYPQQRELATDDLVTFARRRGLLFNREALAFCEREGLIWPLRYLHGGEEAYVPPGTPGCIPSLRDAEHPFALTRALYHPWQVMRLHAIEESLRWRWMMVCDLRPEYWDHMVPDEIQRREHTLARLRSALARSLRQLALLVSIEDLYLPMWRGVLSGSDFEAWTAWRGEVDREAILARVGLTVADVDALRSGLARRWYTLDPCSALVMLHRLVSWKHRDAMRGLARLAWDYYEAAHLLGQLLADVTGERQPHVEDILRGGYWQEGLIGLAPADTDYRGHKTRAAIARFYGVDAQPRLLWLVEGNTERAFIEAYCELDGISLDEESIELHVLGGVNRRAQHGLQKDPLFRAFVRRARTRHAGLLVTVDAKDRGSQDLIRALMVPAESEAPLITETFAVGRTNTEALDELRNSTLVRTAVQWDPMFESANFDAQLLLQAWLAASRVDRTDAPEADECAVRARLTCLLAEAPDHDPWEAVRAVVSALGKRYGDLNAWKVGIGGALPGVLAAERARGQYGQELPVEAVIRNAVDTARWLLRGRREHEDGSIWVVDS